MKREDEESDLGEAARENGVYDETIRRAVRDGRRRPYDLIAGAQGTAALRRKL